MRPRPRRTALRRTAQNGFHMTARELQTCHQFHETTPKREKKNEKSGGRGKKSPKFWAPTLLAPHPSDSPGPFPSGHQPSGTLRGTPKPDSPHCFWVVVCAVLLLILLRCCFSYCCFWAADRQPPHLLQNVNNNFFLQLID